VDKKNDERRFQLMKRLANKTAALTGIVSGTGRMLAVNLARERYNLALGENGGGNIAFEEASMTIHILERMNGRK
jgi:hypothetical protein